MFVNFVFVLLCLRCILNFLYTVVETLRVPREEETDAETQVREAFRQEIGNLAQKLFGLLKEYFSTTIIIIKEKKI